MAVKYSVKLCTSVAKCQMLSTCRLTLSCPPVLTVLVTQERASMKTQTLYTQYETNTDQKQSKALTRADLVPPTDFGAAVKDK